MTQWLQGDTFGFPHIQFALLYENEFVRGDDTGGVHSRAVRNKQARILGLYGTVGF